MPSRAEIVERIYSAFLEGGPDALLENYDDFFTDDFEFHPALVGTIEGGRKYVGREEFADYWREFRSVFPQAKFGEATFEELGNARVVASARIRAEGATSGVPIDQEAGYVFEVREGLVSEMRTFFSSAAAKEFANA